MQLYQAYHPLTAAPFTAPELPPPAPLAPYLRCFWGGAPGPAQRTLVVPDTCADLVYLIDHTAGTVQGSFCAVQEGSFFSYPVVPKGHRVSFFGIRFYLWAAVLFAAQDMSDVKNRSFPAEQFFPTLHKALEPRLLDVTPLPARAALAAKALLAMTPRPAQPLAMEAVGVLLASHGALPAAALAGELHISCRQLERVLRQNLGLGPKSLAGLIRYQCLWQELLCGPPFSLQDAVQKYGFADQAHLQNTFRRYHSLTPRAAVAYARTENVAFLQDGVRGSAL